jgi:hypothetical protein
MNDSTINVPSAGATVDSNSTAQNQQVGQPNANTNVGGWPVRIQRSRQHKQVSPNGLPIVYVGRPGKWGNPFSVSGQDGHWFVLNDNDEPLMTFEEKNDAIDFCIENYKDYILNEISLGTKNPFELKGKNLSCWCSIGCKCHADILLELANM